MIPFNISPDGTLSILVNTHMHQVHTDHPNYDRIREAVFNGEPESDVEPLLDVAQAVSMAFAEEGCKVEVTPDGAVLYDGHELHNSITRRITEYMRNGIPFASLARFLSNLMDNPSHRAVNELFDFLNHEGFPITEDGCFIGYKGVRSDFKDVYSGTMDNSVGQIVSIPRNQVDEDCNSYCSVGLHVGTEDYARGWARNGVVVHVKVNPRDAVSVPRDHSCSKLRVCKYEVVGISQGRMDRPVYEIPDGEPVHPCGSEWQGIDFGEDDWDSEEYGYDDEY